MAELRQIVGYFTASQQKALAAYAQDCDLPLSAIARLLIRRELRRKRIGSLVSDTALTPVATKGPKVVARFATSEDRHAFETYIAGFGLKPTPALSLLLLSELRERWLLRALLEDST